MPVSQMTITEELSRLRSESSALRKQNARLRNSNALLRQRATALAAENKQQKQRIRELEEQVQSIQVQLESLQEALFGRRKRKAKESINQEKQKRKQSSRTAASYQRKQPDASEITHIQEYHQVSCPDCSHPLTHLEEVVRYEEDLPDLEILPKVLKQVTKK
jgi:chromosome segregation ATPase